MGFEQIKVDVQDIYGSDRHVAEAAWTSSLTRLGAERRSEEDVKNVCRKIVGEGHGTPVESIIFRIWMRWPIVTDRQHMTHRIASHNGMSGRYRTLPTDFYEPPNDVRQIMDKALINESVYMTVCRQSEEIYGSLVSHLKSRLEAGNITNTELKRAREFLRGMLPQNNMIERLTTMNLRSLGNYFVHRISEHASPDIRNAAEKIYIGIVTHDNFHLIKETWTAAEDRHFVFHPDPDKDALDSIRQRVHAKPVLQ